MRALLWITVKALRHGFVGGDVRLAWEVDLPFVPNINMLLSVADSDYRVRAVGYDINTGMLDVDLGCDYSAAVADLPCDEVAIQELVADYESDGWVVATGPHHVNGGAGR